MHRNHLSPTLYMAATLPILPAVAVVVLLLTCANVATLTRVRFISRRRELAIRQSLGAQRAQLVRQMVSEGVILSANAATPALLLTLLTAKTLRSDLSGKRCLHCASRNRRLKLNVVAFRPYRE